MFKGKMRQMAGLWQPTVPPHLFAITRPELGQRHPTELVEGGGI